MHVTKKKKKKTLYKLDGSPPNDTLLQSLSLLSFVRLVVHPETVPVQLQAQSHTTLLTLPGSAALTEHTLTPTIAGSFVL